MSGDLILSKSRDFCYTKQAADSFAAKEVIRVEGIVSFLISTLAGIFSYFICKWLDDDEKK